MLEAYGLVHERSSQAQSRYAARNVPSSVSTFRREGDYWTIGHHGAIFRFRDSKGLRYIGHLIRNPGREFYVLDLATTGIVRADGEQSPVPVVLGDAGVVLDAAAKAAYRRRLVDLREELEEAERFSDIGRATQARAEVDVLTSEIAAAVGLGGRDRKMASDVERARVAVTVRIKAAVRKIGQHHLTLGYHLATSIKTGRFCAYNPGPVPSVCWS
jgi:non-specific serine/threonine protein kinase